MYKLSPDHLNNYLEERIQTLYEGPLKEIMEVDKKDIIEKVKEIVNKYNEIFKGDLEKKKKKLKKRLRHA